MDIKFVDIIKYECGNMSLCLNIDDNEARCYFVDDLEIMEPIVESIKTILTTDNNAKKLLAVKHITSHKINYYPIHYTKQFKTISLAEVISEITSFNK